MFTNLNARMRQFRQDDQGYISVEAMIVLPVLLWVFAAGWVYFDAFRQQSVSQKANYVIGDMISRETSPISGTYVTNARKLLRELTKSSGNESDLRLTVVQYDGNTSSWNVVWSKKRGNQTVLNNGGLSDYADKLPTANGGEQLIMVETWDMHEPIFDVGLSDFEIHTYSFTRPRYAPQVVFSNS
ncbi:hypothetical protein TRP8649_04410 [Pelagimonas phthalicica]|uniref:Flp pilus assembly protein TadG n=1 Tax=Pelagimonas phthalicica TaxID=1037362 RepID=A0A238JJE3_9RHOB|nr:hypothetical protein [Pelagimonas phthalicica]TDS90099.1 hypothetical protein CLV87_4156 [Pelagimonas phthalicica]SMX30267.1 hypothetical protein TRP8649_04410 [Pelagimonas phthalicica]